MGQTLFVPNLYIKMKGVAIFESRRKKKGIACIAK